MVLLQELTRLIWAHPNNRNRRARALLRFFVWQAWERIVRRPWTVRLVGRTKVKCYPHSAAGSGVIYCGMIEWRDMRFARDYLRSGDVFVDVGANIGVYSLVASTIPGVTICALEPSKLAYARLLENLEINGVANAITRQVAAGVADDVGHLTIGMDTTNRLVPPRTREAIATEPVEIRAMDSLLTELGIQAPALIKIDVEGRESDVISGLAKTIDASSPVLIVECNNKPQLQRILSRSGYHLCKYDPRACRLEMLADDEVQQNLLAVIDVEVANDRLAQNSTRVG
jgi:FkbM family methyltransferase